MAAYRKSDGRRDDLCGGELRKHALMSWVLLFLFRCFCFVVFVSSVTQRYGVCGVGEGDGEGDGERVANTW